MPRPVKALWAAATPEAQARAHRAATAILRTWLGKATREEAAKELELTPLRFWQLSQQAVAGMVAGCLKQPQARRGRPAMAPGPEEDLRTLRRRVLELEKDLAGARSLISILRELPAHQGVRAEAPEKGHGPIRRRRGAMAPEGAAGGGAPGESKPPGRASGPRDGLRGDDAHASKLGGHGSI
jgi:hypothetical protein